MLHIHLSAQFLALWGIVGGVITTHAAALVNQPRWAAWAKTLTSVGIALVVGLVTAASAGRLNGVDWLTAATAVFAAAQLAYGTLFRGTAQALEAATSPTPAVPNPDGSFTVTTVGQNVPPVNTTGGAGSLTYLNEPFTGSNGGPPADSDGPPSMQG